MSTRFVCPSCHSSSHLWEGIMVSGWRGIDERKRPLGEQEGVNWDIVCPDGSAGCGTCFWRGLTDELEERMALGIDGEELPPQVAGQTSLEDA